MLCPSYLEMHALIAYVRLPGCAHALLEAQDEARYASAHTHYFFFTGSCRHRCDESWETERRVIYSFLRGQSNLMVPWVGAG